MRESQACTVGLVSVFFLPFAVLLVHLLAGGHIDGSAGLLKTRLERSLLSLSIGFMTE